MSASDIKDKKNIQEARKRIEQVSNIINFLKKILDLSLDNIIRLRIFFHMVFYSISILKC